MTTSFKKQDKEKREEEVDQQALAEVSDTDSNLPAEQSSVSLALGQVSGSVDRSDLLIPRLNIVQNVGPLSEMFEGKGGAIILNKETLLAQKDEPIKLTVLSIKKTYEENLPYDPNGPRPRVFESLEEVVDAGLYTDWRNNQQPTAKEVATVLAFIEEPEGVEDLSFSYEFEKKNYALAVWTLRGTAYTRGAKKIFSASQIELAKDGLLSGDWELSTTRTQINGNYVFVPVLRLTGRNSKEKVAFIEGQLS